MKVLNKKLCLLVLVLSVFQSVAYAHNPEQSYIYLQIHDDSITGRFEVTTKDLNKVFGSNLKADLTKEDLAQYLTKLQDYIFQNAKFSSKDDGEYKIKFTDTSFLRAKTFGDFVQLNFDLEGIKKVPEKMDVKYEAFIKDIPGHSSLLVIEENKKVGIADNESIHSLAFSAGDIEKELLTSEGILLRGLWEMIRSGVWHIWIGFDHILFLIALLLPSVLTFRTKDEDIQPESKDRFWRPVEKFKPALINVIKIVTFFTIAHSITLCLAALGVINLPSRLVESIIAISIALAAIHNIFPLVSGREWLIAFIFGLFHGFGFAGILAEKGLGGNYLAISVFGFNLGVEIGQVVIIALIFPILFLLRKTFLYPKIRVYGSIFLILIAIYWFTERAFDIDFPIGGYILRALGLL